MRLPTVYFFVSPSCDMCLEMKPAIEEWITHRAPGRAFGVRLNPRLREYRFGRWSPKYTPSVLLVDEEGQPVRHVEGRLLTVDGIEDFFEGRNLDAHEDEE